MVYSVLTVVESVVGTQSMESSILYRKGTEVWQLNLPFKAVP